MPTVVRMSDRVDRSRTGEKPAWTPVNGRISRCWTESGSVRKDRTHRVPDTDAKAGNGCEHSEQRIVTDSDPVPEVFLVDDDPVVLSATDRLLRGAGYKVRSFASAREFLLRSDPRIPGCAVLDTAMKEIDGFSLQQEMESRGDERPIIFISECDDVATGVKAMKAGATDCLVKPLKDADLLAAIGTALRTDRHARRHHRERRALEQSYDQLTPRERQEACSLPCWCLAPHAVPCSDTWSLTSIPG